MTAIQQIKLWNFGFTLLFLSRFLKVTADNFAAVAFVWLLVETGGSAVNTAMLYVCSLIPQTLLSPFISPLLSRGRLNDWMFISDIIRALIVALTSICYSYGVFPLYLFYILVIMQSATGSIYSPASVAFLPRIVGRGRVQEANAYLQTSGEIATLISLAGAGVLILWISAASALLVTSGVFVASALLILCVRFTQVSVELADNSTQINERSQTALTYYSQICEGFRIVKVHRLLFSLSMYALFTNIGIAPWTALAALFVSKELHGTAATLSTLRGGMAVGALLIGLFLTRVKVIQYGRLFIAAGITEGIAYTILGTSHWTWAAAICCLIIGGSMAAFNVPEMVIIQTTVPERQQAQVYAVVMTMSVALLPFAYLLSGVLAEWIGTRSVIAAGGLLILLSGIAVRLFSPLAVMESEREQSAYLN